MESLNIGILYLSLHNLLKRKVGVNRYTTKKEINAILGRHFLVPKNLRIAVIKELKNMNLIQEDKNEVMIIDCKLDVTEDANKLFKMLKLF
jgi:spore coat polysaccharide biosynthesis predicted glycosyltransferase SpsG